MAYVLPSVSNLVTLTKTNTPIPSGTGALRSRGTTLLVPRQAARCANRLVDGQHHRARITVSNPGPVYSGIKYCALSADGSGGIFLACFRLRLTLSRIRCASASVYSSPSTPLFNYVLSNIILKESRMSRGN